MKVKKSIKNIFWAIVSQLITLGLGIIIPRLFLVSYGSETNGVLSSVGQFFSIISLLEAGIGGVTVQALYKPIANGDRESCNHILAAANIYYKKMGKYYILAVIVLSVIYPIIVKTELSIVVVFFIILFSGLGGAINFFLQYKYTVLLSADGRNYITTNINLVLNIITNIVKIILLTLGYNIIAVQFSQFLIILLRVFLLDKYMHRNYKWIDFSVSPNFDVLSQRNAQLIHQIAYLIFSNTDILVLTLISQDLKLVSVYTIYNTLIGVIEGVISNVNNSLTFAFGQVYAENKEKYRKYFDCYEVIYMAMSFSIFMVTSICILPFLKLYTRGITDINYLDDKLAILFIVMKLFVVMRSQCYNAILISGNFKSTQNSSIIEAIINLSASIILVFKLGIYGTILGTIVGLLYRNTYCIVFANKKVLKRSPVITFKRWGINAILFFVFYILSFQIHLQANSYIILILEAGIMLVIISIIVFIINFIFEIRTLKDILELTRTIFFNKKK